MTRLPVVSGDECIKALQKLGYTSARTTGKSCLDGLPGACAGASLKTLLTRTWYSSENNPHSGHQRRGICTAIERVI